MFKGFTPTSRITKQKVPYQTKKLLHKKEIIITANLLNGRRKIIHLVNYMPSKRLFFNILRCRWKSFFLYLMWHILFTHPLINDREIFLQLRVITFCVTNFSPNQRLKTTDICYLLVSVGQEPWNDLVVFLCLWTAAELLASLSLAQGWENPLSSWLTGLLAGSGPQWLLAWSLFFLPRECERGQRGWYTQVLYNTTSEVTFALLSWLGVSY